jgi:hypothetical protein
MALAVVVEGVEDDLGGPAALMRGDLLKARAG